MTTFSFRILFRKIIGSHTTTAQTPAVMIDISRWKTCEVRRGCLVTILRVVVMPSTIAAAKDDR